MADPGTKLRRYNDMGDVEIAKGDPDVRGWDVVMADGTDIGEVKDLLVDTDAMKVRALVVELDGSRFNWNDNRTVAIPTDSVRIDDDNDDIIVDGYTVQQIGTLPVYTEASTETPVAPPRQVTTSPPPAGRPAAEGDRLTRSEEELRIGKREVEAGEVRVTKHVETEHVSREVPVERERVHVERRPATDASASGRIADDEIRVPVKEEEVVVEKRPVVKEEVVISKERVSEPERVEADVRKERVDVQREGDVPLEGERGRGSER